MSHLPANTLANTACPEPDRQGIPCRYHPYEVAEWINPRTRECFCARCVDAGEDGTANSVIGAEPLQRLAAAQGQGFWEQFDRYLVFPLRWPVAGYWLVVWAVISLVVVSADGPTGLLWVLVLVGLVAVCALGVAVMRQVLAGDANAATSPPGQLLQLRALDPSQVMAMVLAQAGPVALLFGAISLQYQFMTHLAFVAMIVLIPALMLVALREGLAGLANTESWIGCVRGVGWTFVLLSGFFALLFAVVAVTFALFYGELPDSASLPLLLGLVTYSMMVSYRLMGAVALQYRHRLGFAREDRRRRLNRVAGDRLDQIIDMLVRDARLPTLETLLLDTVRTRPQVLRYHELLGRLLQFKGNQADLRAQADRFLEALERAGDEARLLFEYRSQLAQLADYKPASAQVLFTLARLLAEKGEHENAARLLVNMHVAHPRFPGLAEAYWFLARLLAEELAQPEPAMQCAVYVYKTFTDFSERAEVEKFIKVWRQGRA